MLNGAFNLLSNARDLGFQRDDPRLEFPDGEGVEILTRQCCDRIVGTAGQVFFRAHVTDR